MSLSLLLDEHISPAVAVQIQAKRPEIPIQSIYHWRQGLLVSQDDEPLLAAAAGDGLTLVTYDQQTIPALLDEIALLGRSHSGVIFVDDQTIAPRNLGGLVLALIALWEDCQAWDWGNRLMFLQRPKP